MPHFGLMNEKALGPEKGGLLRAKFHIRSGKRRLREGKISLGVITLFDALQSALSSYVASAERRAKLDIKKDDDLRDEGVIFNVLTRSDVLDGSYSYEKFKEIAYKALEEEMPDYDYKDYLRGVEAVMTQLGVMPFNEDELPPEAPGTV